MLKTIVTAALIAFGTACLCPTADAAKKVAAPTLNLPTHTHTEICDDTSPEPMQIVCILDRSGSMHALVTDTIGGYNSFLAEQKKKNARAEVITVLFDSEYEKLVDTVPLADAPVMTDKDYYARGMTALLDAVGRTVSDTLGQMEKKGICPEKRKVLFLIMTDGQENSSKEYNKQTVKALVNMTKEKYHWNYVFMGANIDSVAEAGAIGIDAKHAANYDHNAGGVKQSFARMGAAVDEVQATGSVGGDWKKE